MNIIARKCKAYTKKIYNGDFVYNRKGLTSLK